MWINKIVNHLLINASSITDIGLFHGKLGISIFFYHYARYTGSLIYTEFAGLLIDEVCDELHDKLPIGMEEGLCGIGWGIEYLVQNEFIQGDTSEILYELDQVIMRRDIRREEDYSFETGLEGIAYYVGARQAHDTENRKHNVFDNIFIHDFETKANAVVTCSQKKYLYLESAVVKDKQVDYMGILPSLCNVNPNSSLKMTNLPLGLKDGLAGMGLNLIL